MTLKPSRFKNSTDIALVIGAMDLLVERAARGTTTEQNTTVDAVIIASSDSDYSALALHLRASGIEVIGMGKEGNVNSSWPRACSEFIAFSPVDETRQREQSKPHITPSPREADDQAAAHGAAHSPKQRKHTDRVTNIREFISDQLSKNDGQMPTASLFNLLKELPDYVYDQKQSKQSPLNYLTRQYSDLLKIQKNSNGALWVYSKLTDVTAVTEVEKENETPQESTPPQKFSQDTESTFTLADFLCGAGVDETDAQKISSAYEQCLNMRDAYNVLRKLFKTEIGTTYYKLVKQYRESQNKK